VDRRSFWLSERQTDALPYGAAQCSAVPKTTLKKVRSNNEDGVLFINFDSKWGKGYGRKHRCWKEMVNKDKRKNTRVDGVLK
jgi:hypothetical protein